MRLLPLTLKFSMKINAKETQSWTFLQQLLQRHVFQDTDQASIEATLHKQSINIPQLSVLMAEHRLELIVWSILKNKILPTSPIYSSLNRQCLYLIQQHLQQKKRLNYLADYLNTQGIAYVFFKGLPLNQLLYDHHCLRRSRDLDLLLTSKDLPRVHDHLIQQGFELRTEFSPKQLLASKQLREIYKELSYFHPHDQTVIELHIQLTRLGNLGLDCTQEKIKTFLSLGDQKIACYVPEAHFFYLCVHAAMHHWQRFQWLVDLAVFWQRIPLNWNQVEQFFQTHHMKRPLLEAKMLLKSQFGIELPTLQITRWDKLICKGRLKYSQHLWHLPEKNSGKNFKHKNSLATYFNWFITLLLLPNRQQKLRYLKSKIGILQLKKYPERPFWLRALITLKPRWMRLP